MIGETAKTSQVLGRARNVGYPAQPVAPATMASAEALQRRLQRMA
jgi:hypothetical protein